MFVYTYVKYVNFLSRFAQVCVVIIRDYKDIHNYLVFTKQHTLVIGSAFEEFRTETYQSSLICTVTIRKIEAYSVCKHNLLKKNSFLQNLIYNRNNIFNNFELHFPLFAIYDDLTLALGVCQYLSFLPNVLLFFNITINRIVWAPLHCVLYFERTNVSLNYSAADYKIPIVTSIAACSSQAKSYERKVF